MLAVFGCLHPCVVSRSTEVMVSFGSYENADKLQLIYGQVLRCFFSF